MAESEQNPAPPGENPLAPRERAGVRAAPEDVDGELAEEAEPEGPDPGSLNYGSLGPESRALLDSMLSALEAYAPQPGTLSDLPQVTVDRQHIADVCRTMKDDERFGAKMLLCLTAVDFPAAPPVPGPGGGAGMVQMVYILQSLEPERTLVLKTEAPYDDPVVPSVSGIWRAADWYEREAHDLFGVSFDGHPDLAPLLLYDEFEGYPGRKEFPFYEYREF